MRKKRYFVYGLISLSAAVVASLLILVAVQGVSHSSDAERHPEKVAHSEGLMQHERNIPGAQSHLGSPDSRGIPANSAQPEIDVNSQASNFAARSGALYETHNLASEFSALAAAAENGDMIAARTLVERTRICQLAPQNQVEMERFKSKLKDPNYPYADDPVAAKAALEEKEYLFNHCGILSDEQSESRLKWIRLLADSGDWSARSEFVALGFPKDYERVDFEKQRSEFVATAKEYLNEEISAGNVSALASMAHAYMRPTISGAPTPFNIDPALAYRYNYAYALSPETAQISSSLSTILARLENQLSADQIAEERRAAEIMFQNCCSSAIAH